MKRLHWATEAGLVALLAAAMIAECVGSDEPASDVNGWTIALIVLASAPVLLRYRNPLIATVACMAMLFVVIPTLQIYQTVPFPTMVAGYAFAVVSSRRATVLAGVGLAPFVLLAIGINSQHGLLHIETPKNLAFVALPLVLGTAVKDRRAYLAALVERAETAERTRDEETRRRVGEERLRIARDVHDVVAHAMVAINVQAGVGAHLLDQDTEQARSTLLDIKRVSGEALADLRSTLGVLRATGDDQVPVSPTSGIPDLEELGATMRAAGIDVRLDLDPRVASLPASIGSTGYRIVQEALTNVLRHAGPSRTDVTVRRVDDRLVIDVTDDGHGPGAGDGVPGSGHGVRGMRERAEALGGSLEAGPAPDRGWRVSASIPVAGASS